jgi:hypothetical protein
MSIEEYIYLQDCDETRGFFNSGRNFFKLRNKYSIVKNAYVIGQNALITDVDKNLVENLLHESYYWTPNCFDGPHKDAYNDEAKMEEALLQRRSYINFAKDESFLKAGDQLEILKYAVFLLHPFGWYAFGHLNDSLLRLKSLEPLSLIKDIPILVSDYARVVDFEVHLTVLLGFKPTLIRVSKEQILKIENLVVPINSSEYTSFIKTDYIWFREKYLEHFSIRDRNLKPYRLYLSRNHVAEGSRSVINEAEVEGLLKSNGFIILNGTETLEKIVEYFYYAELVIGYHGSLFANLIFSRHDCRVLEFCAKNREDRSFQNKYKLATKYIYKLVDADDKFNATLDLKVIKFFLEEKS